MLSFFPSKTTAVLYRKKVIFADFLESNFINSLFHAMLIYVLKFLDLVLGDHHIIINQHIPNI